MPVAGGERIPTNYSCGDYAVLNDHLTSGTEKLSVWTPCWDLEDGDLAVADQRPPDASEITDERLELRAEEPRLRRDRVTTAQLAGSQAAMCKGLAPRDIEQSPFVHRKAIIEVVPHRESGELRGAHIVFAAVPGLNADWMRRAIACHQARYANLGNASSHLPGDPTLVEGARVTVSQHGSQINVLVTTDTEAAGRVALGRAEALTGARTATR